MLEPPAHLCVDPAPFRAQPMGNGMDKRAIRQACQSIRQVLQLKLQQRRSRQELINQGIMPPLKGSTAFHEHRRSLERARTEDYLKTKFRCRPERSELIRMHILEQTRAEPCLQATQLQLKRARLADDLNVKLSHRPGPMELIHKNILPVHSSIKRAIIDFPKASGESSSFDEDSSDSLSPEPLCSLDLPEAPGPLLSPLGSLTPSPTQFLNQVPPSASSIPTKPASTMNLTNETAVLPSHRDPSPPSMKSQHKMTSLAYRPKKLKDQPKIRKLKYHQYVPPDQRGGKEPPAPPQLDSSYAKLLQQQQLFLQLQILSQQKLQQKLQQQQNNNTNSVNYATILPARPKDHQSPPATSSSSSSSSSAITSISATAPSSPPRNTSAPPASQSTLTHQRAASAGETMPQALPSNLDEMKVAELKAELKQRHLTVSGTKSDLIERLKAYQELHTVAGGGVVTGTPSAAVTITVSTPSSLLSAGGAAEPEARSVGGSALGNPSPPPPPSQQGHIHTSTSAAHWTDPGSSASPSLSHTATPPPPLPPLPPPPPPQQVMTFGGLHPSSPVSPSPHAGSPSAISPENDYTTTTSNGLDDMATSPPAQRCLHTHAPTATIKEEQTSCLPTAYSTQKLFVYSPTDSNAVFSPPSSTMVAAVSIPTAISTSNTASSGAGAQSAVGNGATVAPCEDRDRMLRDKDRQIEMLTRMLNQKQRLVELLRMQLEQGNRGSRLGGGGGGGGGGRAKIPEAKVLIHIKKEPGETSPVCLAAQPDHQPQTSGAGGLAGRRVSYAKPHNVAVKQESAAEKDVMETQPPLCPTGLSVPAFPTVGPGGPPGPEGPPDRSGNHANGPEQQIRLQQAALQLAQQRAIQKLLLQQQNQQNQQHLLQNPGQQNQQNLQQRSQQRKKKSHKQQLKQQQQQQQLLSQSQQQQQLPKQSQTQPKQQVPLRQQQSVMLQSCKQQQQQPMQQKAVPLRHQSPIQAKVQQLLHAKQQQTLTQQTPQQENQGSQLLLNQQNGSATSFNLDYLNTVVAPALLTDGNGNHFLVALTNHVSEIQKSSTTDNIATTQNTPGGVQATPLLPRQLSPQPDCPHNQSEDRTYAGSLKVPNRKEAGPQVTIDQSQQGGIHSLSSFFDNETLGKDALLPSVKTEEEEEVFSVLDHSLLFSPLSPASLRTPASSPGYRENNDDLFDILFQTGEISSSFKPSPDPSLDGLHTSTPLPSIPPPLSPLQRVLSPPTSPSPVDHLNFPHAINKVLSYLNTRQHPTLCPQEVSGPASDTTPITSAVTIKEEIVVEEEEEEERGAFHSSGRLEDFLESTTGTPLLGAEPGSPLTLIDDLHSQLLSSSSILELPSSPMDTFDLHGCLADPHPGPTPATGGQMVDVMEWLDLTMGTGEGLSEDMLPTDLAPLAPPTPVSVFSADFLNISDLQMGWDSCL